MRYLTFDIGGTGIKHALIDQDYRLSNKGSFPTAGVTSSTEMIEALGEVFDRYADRVAGVAVSTCGELDPATGHVFSGGSLQFNNGIDLIDLLEARCGRPVTVENDANCALLAEVHDGALAEATNAVVLTIGTGVGGALMLNRRIYHGSHFYAGNASLLLSCLDEEYSVGGLFGFTNGVGGLTGRLARRKGVDPATLDGRAVFDLVDAGDADAVAALDEFSSRLARFVYNVQVMFDVEVVALGGGISARPAFIDAVTHTVDTLFDGSVIPVPRPRVRACTHLNDANLIGALYHHLHVGAD